MPLLKVIKDSEGFKIVDNLEHETLNRYDLAFSKGYTLAQEGKEEKDIIAMLTNDDPEYDKGLREGFAQYALDQYRADIEDSSIMMHDSLKKAIFKYSVNPTQESFKAVIDAHRRLTDDDSEEHLSISEDGEDLALVYKYGKDELLKAKKLLEENPDLKITAYDEESGDVIIKDISDSKLVKVTPLEYQVVKGESRVKSVFVVDGIILTLK